MLRVEEECRVKPNQNAERVAAAFFPDIRGSFLMHKAAEKPMVMDISP